MILPKTRVPNLQLPLVNDTQWKLDAQSPKFMTLLIFYRGLHCPVCKKQLEALKDQLSEFDERGINLVAISMDSEKRAKKSYDEWDIASIPVAYNLSEKDAREWGLYISEAISDKESEVFSEPGLFLIRPDGTLYSSSVQSMPFARPRWEDLLKGIDFIKKEEYPARGGH